MSEYYTFEEQPELPERISDADHIYGDGWLAARTLAGFTLSWDRGEIQSEEVTVQISKEEFDRLRTDPAAFGQLALKYDP